MESNERFDRVGNHDTTWRVGLPMRENCAMHSVVKGGLCSKYEQDNRPISRDNDLGASHMQTGTSICLIVAVRKEGGHG
jgi:hypothetical protein